MSLSDPSGFWMPTGIYWNPMMIALIPLNLKSMHLLRFMMITRGVLLFIHKFAGLLLIFRGESFLLRMMFTVKNRIRLLHMTAIPQAL